MSGAKLPDETGQLRFALPGGRNPASFTRPRMWLLAAAPADFETIRRQLFGRSVGRLYRYFFLSGQDGALSVGNRDLILLRDPETETVDLFAPRHVQLCGEDRNLLKEVQSSLNEPTQSDAYSSISREILMVLFAGHGLPLNRPIESAASLARLLDRLQRTDAQTNRFVAEQMSRRILSRMPQQASPVTRGLIRRIRASALLQTNELLAKENGPWGEVAELFSGAADDFRANRLSRQASECARLAATANEMLPDSSTARQFLLPEFDRLAAAAPVDVPFGFVARRCLGIPLALNRQVAVESAPGVDNELAHRWIGRLSLSDRALLRCIQGVASSNLRSSAALAEGPAGGACQILRAGLAEEHAVMLGVQRRTRPRLFAGETVVVGVRSPSCDATPRRAILPIGSFGEFSISPRRPGRHRLVLDFTTSFGDNHTLTVPFSSG